MNKLFTVFILASFGFCAQAQVQSNGTGGGNWSDPATWQGGIVPDFNSAAITILGGDNVIVDANFTIDETTVQLGASLYINSAFALTINNGAGTDFTMNGDLTVEGELILTNASTHAGMTAGNTNFLAGSTYRHRFTTTQGVLPLATWNIDSRVSIEGYTSTFTANAGGNWNQNFGNFTWNCTSQTGTAILAGLLTSVNTFEVLSTGSNILRLSVNQNPTITIAGNVEIGGTSRVEFSTTGTNTVVDVAGDFIFNSTNASGTRSLLVTTGTCVVNIAGNFSMNAPGGNLRFATGAAGIGTLNISGDFDLQAGTLSESGGTTANGNVNFIGTDVIHQFSNAGIISNTINYLIPATNTLVVQNESNVSGTTNSSLTVNGTLVVESENATGAIITGTGSGLGNVRVTNRVYNPGSVVIFRGSGAQFMGNGQPTGAGITTIIDNAAGVTQVSTTLLLLGNLTIQTGSLIISNTNLTVDGITDIQAGDISFTSIGTTRTLTLNGDVNLDGNIVVTSGTANANVVFGGDVTGGSTISFSGANSNLTINGTGDLVFPLSGPTSLETLTANRSSGILTFNETLDINTNAGASAFNITDGGVEINADVNGRDITVTNGSSLTVIGNTTLTNTLTITDGTVQSDGDLSIANDLIVTSGDIIANGSVTLTDDLTLGAGTTFSFLDQEVTFNGSLTNNGGTFISNSSSTLNILGTGVFGTIAFDPGSELGTFVLNRPTGGTLVTLNSPVTITGIFDLLNGGFLNTSGLDFASGAIVTRNSAASFIATSTVPTGGPYDLIYEGTSFTTGVEFQGSINDFVSNSTGTITATLSPAGTATIDNDFIINSGGFTLTTATSNLTILGLLTHSGTTFTSNNNAVSVGAFLNNGTFNAPSSSNTLTITAGNFTNNGTFSANTSTTVFEVSTAILGATNPVFRNITIAVGGDLTPPVGPTPLELAGDFTNNGVFNQGTGTVSFRNTVNGLKTISGTQPIRFYNLNIENNTSNPDVSVAGTVNLANVLTLSSNAILDADGPGGTGVLTLLSSADNPTADGSIASLLGSSAVTGNVTVQRHMATEGANNARIYRYISSPVQSSPVSQIQPEIPVTGTFTGTSTCTGCGTNQSMFLYNESVITDTNGSGGNNFDDGYEDFPNAANSETLTPGRGYSIFVRGNIDPVAAAGSAKWDVRAQINSGNINFNSFTTFTSSTVVANDGWNLVGNPYPSTIDWDAPSGWTRTGINDAIYMRDNGVLSPVYATYVGGVGINGGSRYIATGQAFFVKSDGGPVNFQATESVKAAGTQTIFFRQEGINDVIRVALKRDGITDETVVRFNEGATEGFDPTLDAYKLNNAVFNLSSVSGNAKYAINALAGIACSSSIQLDVSNVTPGTYQLDLSQFDSFDSSMDLKLIDDFLGQAIDLRQNPSYEFAVTDDTKSYGNRFKLSFAQSDINNSIIPEGNSGVCAGQSYSITLPTSESNVVYYASLSGTTISDDFSGTGSSLNLPVDASQLTDGENSILVYAKRPTCDATVALAEPVKVVVDNVYKIQAVTDGSTCQSGSVLLSASGAPTTGSYHWYESMASEQPIAGATGNTLQTPVLDKSKTYYVSAVNSFGCEGERKVVKAEVVKYEEVVISEIETGILSSSYTTGNVWYLNDTPIPDATNQTLAVSESGVYKVETSIGNCKSTSAREYSITGLESELAGSGVSYYPNPVTDLLTVRVAHSDNINRVDLISSTGVRLESATIKNSEAVIDMRNHPAGLYLIKLIGVNNSVSTFKILRK
jgi:hypothetical protein